MEFKEILDNTGLNWSVRKEDVLSASGLIIPDKSAIIREDNNTVLGIMGSGYEPYQNNELIELLHRISNSTGMLVTTGGSFGSGKKVWFQLKSDNLRIGTDTIEGYVTGVNSFDGSTNLGFGNSNVTVSCQNTFFRAYKEVGSKLKHTTNMRPKIDEVLRKIDLLLQEERIMFNDIKRLSEIPMTKEMEDMVIRTMFQLNQIDKVGELSSRKDNRINVFKNGLNSETAQKGNTAWGLFSGATFYTTHKQFNTAEKSNLNKMFGKTGMLEQQVFNNLVKMTR